MKLFGKTRDGVTDRLLRAYVSRPADARQVCPDFDPDLANAYLERSLTTSSRSRFEAHLSECAACRKNVVALMRFAEADRTASVFAGRGEVQAARLSPAMRVFAVLSRPQWAMAAAGVIVLAISLPLLLSSNNSRLSKQVSQAVSTEEQSSDKSQVAFQPDEASKVASLKQAELSASSGAASKQRELGEAGRPATNAGTPGDAPTELAKSRAAGSEQPQKLESKTEPPAIDDLQSKTKSQGQVAAQAPAQAGAQPAGETQLARKDADSGRQQQQEKDSAQASNSKSSRADEDRAGKEKASKSDEIAAVPPPAPSSEPDRARRDLRQPRAKLSLRDSRTNDAVRPAEKSIRGKKFLFKDDTWTDKDFDPEKDLPVVTIIRDSNVYKEVLGKRAGLKPYLTAFAETERAIIVYKGTVYKLIPQGN